jgi:ribokinase
VNILAARVAKESGTIVMLDIGGRDEPLSEELLNLVQLISPNETELDRVTGMKAHNFEEAKKGLLHFVTCTETNTFKRDLTVVLKMGAEGSVFLKYHKGTTQVDEVFKPAFDFKDFPDLKLVDTTGAGDCFTAGFAVKYAQGASMDEAIHFGN